MSGPVLVGFAGCLGLGIALLVCALLSRASGEVRRVWIRRAGLVLGTSGILMIVFGLGAKTSTEWLVMPLLIELILCFFSRTLFELSIEGCGVSEAQKRAMWNSCVHMAKGMRFVVLLWALAFVTAVSRMH